MFVVPFGPTIARLLHILCAAAAPHRTTPLTLYNMRFVVDAQAHTHTHVRRARFTLGVHYKLFNTIICVSFSIYAYVFNIYIVRIVFFVHMQYAYAYKKKTKFI